MTKARGRSMLQSLRRGGENKRVKGQAVKKREEEARDIIGTRYSVVAYCDLFG